MCFTRSTPHRSSETVPDEQASDGDQRPRRSRHRSDPGHQGAGGHPHDDLGGRVVLRDLIPPQRDRKMTALPKTAVDSPAGQIGNRRARGDVVSISCLPCSSLLFFYWNWLKMNLFVILFSMTRSKETKCSTHRRCPIHPITNEHQKGYIKEPCAPERVFRLVFVKTRYRDHKMAFRTLQA